MTKALFVALLIAGSTPFGTVTGCPKVQRISLPLSKPLLKITSHRDPLFGHLIGLSRAAVLDCQGEPDATKPGAWTYFESLGPGAHSFRHSWVVKFRRNKVIEVEVRRKGIGCILIRPPRE